RPPYSEQRPKRTLRAGRAYRAPVKGAFCARRTESPHRRLIAVGVRAAARRPVSIARGAPPNLALLALLAVAFLTGWLAFAFATSPARWSLVLHATGGFAILALLPWKSM